MEGAQAETVFYIKKNIQIPLNIHNIFIFFQLFCAKFIFEEIF